MNKSIGGKVRVLFDAIIQYILRLNIDTALQMENNGTEVLTDIVNKHWFLWRIKYFCFFPLIQSSTLLLQMDCVYVIYYRNNQPNPLKLTGILSKTD